VTDPTPPTPVPTTNAGAQDAVTLIETLGQQGETAAEAAIIAAAPVMGTPVLMQLWEAVFEWVANLILKPLASLGGKVVIDVEEYVALTKAASAQAALDAAKQSGDANAISKASSDVDTAVAGVVQYVGGTRS
jgi:hypothetical protein